MHAHAHNLSQLACSFEALSFENEKRTVERRAGHGACDKEPFALKPAYGALSYDPTKPRVPCGDPLPTSSMSGFEVVGVIGTAATLIDLSAKIWKHLDTFVRRSKEADAVARDLQSKVHQLRICSQTVQRARRSRKRQARSEVQDPGEAEIWKSINRSLSQCERMFQSFEMALEGLMQGKEDSSWLSKALLQRRIEKREPRIARLERKIDVHLKTLNISILSVHLCVFPRCIETTVRSADRSLLSIVHMAHHNEIKSMFAESHLAVMNRLDESLQSGRDQLHRSTEPLQVSGEQEEPNSTFDTDSAVDMGEGAVHPSDPPDEISNLRIALDAGTTVRAKSVYNSDAESVWSPLADAAGGQSIFSGNTEGHTSTLSFGLASSGLRQNAIDASNDDRLTDPTPYFDDTTPREVLEALIKRLRKQVEVDRSAGHYHQAEENQLEAIIHLEELYIGYGEPFEDLHREQMQIQLAEIYYEQEKDEEAHKLIVAGLQEKSMPGAMNAVKALTMVNVGVTPASTRHYYLLALTHRRRYLRDASENRFLYLEAAEREAKRAFKCSFEDRESHDALFMQTVTLLIEIYEDKGKLVHAATYRDLYLRQSEQSRNPPSPPSSFLFLPITRQYTPTLQSDTSTSPDLRKGSDAMPVDLISAIVDGRDDLIDDLLQVADLERCSDGKTAVMHAVERGNEKVIRKLHQKGAKLDQALFQAVRIGRVDMTRLLLKLDANKEAKEASGATPLLVAAGSTHESVVRELLENSADVKAQDREGWSVVHWAAHKGSVGVMRVLLDPKYNVNKNAVCSVGKTALHYLAEKASVEVATVLLEHGADANIKDKTAICRTPLYIAVQRRKYNFVSLLLRHGVIFERGSLPDTSQAIRNLLGPAERPSFASTERANSVSTMSTSRTTLRSRISLHGLGARLRRP